MTFSPARQLTAILLLVVVLLAPLNSIAHVLNPSAMVDRCVLQLQSSGCNGESNDEFPENHPENHAKDCCDHEECFPDDLVSTGSFEIEKYVIKNKLFCPNTAKPLPEVYLPLFVPPES